MDAQVSALAWERSAYRKRGQGFSLGKLTSLLLSALTTLFSQIGWVTKLEDQRADLPEAPCLLPV